jgi:lauroyl/myristoyl acyltransferase
LSEVAPALRVLGLNVRVKSIAARVVNALRSVKPSWLVPLVVALRARLGRHRPALMDDARTQMRWVVGDDQPAETIDRLAAAYVKRMIWRGEARWHPELVTRQPVMGLEHLRALQDAGSAYIISFAHHGDYEAISPSLAWAGFPSHVVTTDEMFADEMPVWMAQQKRVVAQPGVTLVSVSIGSAGIKEVLRSGHAVALGADILGHTPVRFLGHDVKIASGAARLARDCDVPVVVVTSRPQQGKPGGCAELTVTPPLHHTDFETHQDLLVEMLRRHEAAISAWPEATEYPMRRFDPELLIGFRARAEEPVVLKPDPTEPPGYSTAEPGMTEAQD